MSAMCELMNMHQRIDDKGNVRGCSGRCLGNDASTAVGNSAGDQVRVICTCECHKAAQ